jgi:hypothetical protein
MTSDVLGYLLDLKDKPVRDDRLQPKTSNRFSLPLD